MKSRMLWSSSDAAPPRPALPLRTPREEEKRRRRKEETEEEEKEAEAEREEEEEKEEEREEYDVGMWDLNDRGVVL